MNGVCIGRGVGGHGKGGGKERRGLSGQTGIEAVGVIEDGTAGLTGRLIVGHGAVDAVGGLEVGAGKALRVGQLQLHEVHRLGEGFQSAQRQGDLEGTALLDGSVIVQREAQTLLGRGVGLAVAVGFHDAGPVSGGGAVEIDAHIAAHHAAQILVHRPDHLGVVAPVDDDVVGGDVLRLGDGDLIFVDSAVGFDAVVLILQDKVDPVQGVEPAQVDLEPVGPHGGVLLLGAAGGGAPLGASLVAVQGVFRRIGGLMAAGGGGLAQEDVFPLLRGHHWYGVRRLRALLRVNGQTAGTQRDRQSRGKRKRKGLFPYMFHSDLLSFDGSPVWTSARAEPPNLIHKKCFTLKFSILPCKSMCQFHGRTILNR